MRIISHDDMTDFAYEQSMIYVNRQQTTQLWSSGHNSEDGFLIGEYLSEEDAKFALKYINSCFVNNYSEVEVPSAKLCHDFRRAYETHKNPGEKIAEFYERMRKVFWV